jgi:ABC-2 type transport system permease protein
MTNLSHRVVQAIRLAGKEWQLLLRNPHGLAVLFLMPAAFILVMSFTLKNTLITRVELPRTGWVVEEEGAAARQWVLAWMDRHGGERFADRAALQVALKTKRVEAGVLVKKPWAGADGQPLAGQLELWLGNRVQPAAAARLRVELTVSMLRAKMRMAAAEAGPFASLLMDEAADVDLLSADHSPRVRYLYEIESGRSMTAVQQSVPAWLTFGMFFVVIPLAGVLIQERNDGTLTRLLSFGVAPGTVMLGKLIAFLALNWVQLAFMLMVGAWVVPLLGGDALHLDVHAGWFAVMVLTIGTAAVGLALLIATHSKTFDHAAALGGGVNVILAAVAGVMVPRMLMPPTLQAISEWSPMGWALDGMQSVFLGEPDAAFVLPRAGLLLAFAAICWMISARAFGARQT